MFWRTRLQHWDLPSSATTATATATATAVAAAEAHCGALTFRVIKSDEDNFKLVSEAYLVQTHTREIYIH